MPLVGVLVVHVSFPRSPVPLRSLDPEGAPRSPWTQRRLTYKAFRGFGLRLEIQKSKVPNVFLFLYNNKENICYDTVLRLCPTRLLNKQKKNKEINQTEKSTSQAPGLAVKLWGDGFKPPWIGCEAFVGWLQASP